MVRHPSKYELFAHAESLADRGRPISAQMAAHLSKCPACAQEVRGILGSLRMVKAAAPLEPTAKSTAAILLAAREQRQIVGRKRQAFGQVLAVGRGMTYAAGVVLLATVCFGAVIRDSDQQAPTALAASSAPAKDTAATAVAANTKVSLEKATEEAHSLAIAVGLASEEPATYQVREQRRSLAVLGTDIEAAQSALERNPACDRANALVDTTIRRQAKELKSLYIGRSL